MARRGERVGFVGLGNMGWPMARHLVEGGIQPLVFDAAPQRRRRNSRRRSAAASLAELRRRESATS